MCLQSIWKKLFFHPFPMHLTTILNFCTKLCCLNLYCLLVGYLVFQVHISCILSYESHLFTESASLSLSCLFPSSGTPYLNTSLLDFILCVLVYMHVCMNMWRTEDNLWESVSSPLPPRGFWGLKLSSSLAAMVFTYRSIASAHLGCALW